MKGHSSTSAIHGGGEGAVAQATMPPHPVMEPNALIRPEDDEEKGRPTQDRADSTKDAEEKEGMQYGVRTALAMLEVMTKRDLIVAYILIWLIYFVLNLASGITRTLTPYVTSDFQFHSLTATTTIVSNLLGGLAKLPYAKLIDVWGRPQGFALMVLFMTVGLIMMAACKDVQTYCAAQVFYNVGYLGITFALLVFIADTSSLKNRAFTMAFTSSSGIATAWVYGPATDSILKTIGFRWGFGIWAIIVPVVCAPLFFLFWYKQKEAEKAGLVPPRRESLPPLKLAIYYCHEFDVVGLLLIASGLSLLLLSLSLYSYQAKEWASPLVISFIVVGTVLVIAFVLYERFLAPVRFVSWDLLKDRTILSTYVACAFLYVVVTLSGAYFYSFLVIVFNQTVTQATYILNIYSVGSCFFILIFGVAFRFYGRVKWYMLFLGVPFFCLGTGLMLNFLSPHDKIGWIVFCQILIALGGGVVYLCEQIVLMAVSTQQDFPSLLALEHLVIEVGESIGSAVAAAIWTGVFPDRLLKYLPADTMPHFREIYGSLVVQGSYPVGSPTRLAIDHAYGDTQQILLIVSTALFAVPLVAVAFWNSRIDVRTMKKHEGALH